MPHLNWREAPITQSIETDAEGRSSTLILGFAPSDTPALLERLESTYLEDGGESRVDLPRSWVIFWKKREEGESRLLVAHPQADEWVATVALDPLHGRRLVESLRRLGSGAELRVDELGSVASLSNLQLKIRVG